MSGAALLDEPLSVEQCASARVLPGKREASTLRVTAVVPSARTISVVTLSWHEGRLRLAPSGTTFFALPGDDQASVRKLADTMYLYFHERQISELLVRRGPRAGAYQASSGAVVFETILQLLPLSCAHVGVHKVVNWARDDWRLPAAQRQLLAPARKLQECAIETAAFGLAHLLSRAGPAHA